jgi:hypothetical protein
MTPILLETLTLPDNGTVELNFHHPFTLKISAQEAQRQVNRWVLLDISCVMGTQAPTLVIGTQVVWRVPVVLSATHIGVVGTVGTIDVDVQTAEMNITPSRKAEFERAAMQLAETIPPYTPRTDVPTEYLANHLLPTHPKPRRNQSSKPELIASLA